MQKAKVVDAYIAQFPKDVQVVLKKMRTIVHKSAPTAEESISYGLVGYKLAGKPLVYFGGWREHVGFYATPSGNLAFKKELAPYKGAKGSVKFALSEKIPYPLIAKMVKYRVKEEKARAKTAKK
jgi:uncharacterized protein YdhG (YjbR/CyaY superfamily)